MEPSYFKPIVISIEGVLVLTTFYIIFTIVRIYLARQKHEAMKALTTSTGLVLLGLLISYVSSIFAELVWFDIPFLMPYLNYETQNIVLIAGFTSYLVGWIGGLRTFTQAIIRLPKDRETAFLRFTSALTGISLLAFLSLIVLVFTHDFIIYNVSLSLIALLIVTVLSLIAFIYYYGILGHEINKNASKLIRARLQLVRYAILAQLFIPLSIFVIIVLEIVFNLRGYIGELVAFIIISIMSIITAMIMYWIVYLPEPIRKRFNLATTRFKSIQLLSQKE